MINLIVLAASEYDAVRMVNDLPEGIVVAPTIVTNDNEIWLLQSASSRWSGHRNRVHVTASARVTARQINALQVLHARFGIEDPTGLCGLPTATYFKHDGDAGRGVFGALGRATGPARGGFDHDRAAQRQKQQLKRDRVPRMA